MTAIALVVFGGGFATALHAMLSAGSGHSAPRYRPAEDDFADVDRILEAPYTPACLWWEAIQ